MKKFLTLVIVFAFITLLAGCNDIKPNTNETTPYPVETSIPTETGETDTLETAAPETTAPETDYPETDIPETPASETEPTPETDVPVLVDPADSVTVLSNPKDYSVQTVYIPVSESGRASAYPYSDSQMLYMTFDLVTDAQGVTQAYSNIKLYLVDKERGRIVGECAIDGEYQLNNISYNTSGDGIVLRDIEYDHDKGYIVHGAFHTLYSGGELTATKVESAAYPQHDMPVIGNAHGGLVYAYRTTDDGVGRGGIDLKAPDGTVMRILSHLVFDDAGRDAQNVVYYIPVGFIGATVDESAKLVYNIGAYEGAGRGFGIYDTATGEREEFLYMNYRAIDVWSNSIYFEEYKRTDEGYSESYRIWKRDRHGNMTLLWSLDPADGDAYHEGESFPSFNNGLWYFYSYPDIEVPSYIKSNGYVITEIRHGDDFDPIVSVMYPHTVDRYSSNLLVTTSGRATVVIRVPESVIPLYTNVEFTTHTHTYTYKNNPFYGYSTTFDIPSYCYRANGGYFEQIWHLDYPTVLRVSLTAYEYSYAEFVAGKNIYENKINDRNPITVTKDNGEIINGYFGDYDEGGITYRLYAFYFPTEYQDKGFVLMLWEMPDNDGKYYYNNVILPIVRSMIVEAGATEVYDAILESRAPVYFPSTKEEKLLSEYLEETERSLMKYTIIDLDGDEKEEMVLFIEFNTHTDAVFLVFHRDGDIVYAHEIPYRGMNGLKTDGTFSFSSGAADSGIGKFAFLGDTYSVIKLAYSESASNNDVSYYIEDNPVRYQDFRSYWSTYYYKPDMKWTENDETTDDNSVIEFPFDPVNFVVTLSESTGEKVLFWHQIFASPVYLYFVPCDTGTLEFTVYVYKDYSMVTNREEEGLSKLTLHLPDTADFGGVARDVVTCDSAEPVWVGGGGGSGECRFVVKLTKGDEAAYIYYNNFHYETDILDFRYAGAVPEEDLEYFMEYYPGIFGN